MQIKRTIIFLGTSFNLVITLFMPQCIGPLNRQSVQAKKDGQYGEKDVFALTFSSYDLISNFAVINYYLHCFPYSEVNFNHLFYIWVKGT